MEKVNAFLKRKNIVFSAKRYGIDALGAMAQGLFCSLLIGTILNTLGTQFHIGFLTAQIGEKVPYTIGGLTSFMSGPAMAIAIGYALQAPPLVLFSLAAVGYACNLLGGAGGPLAVLFVAIIAAECGKAVSKETKIDILVTPIVTTLIGVGTAALIVVAIVGSVAYILGCIPFWGTITVESCVNGRCQRAARIPRRGRCKLRAFNVEPVGLDAGKSYFQATKERRVDFVPNRPVFWNGKQVKKVPVASGTETVIRISEEDPRSLRIRFDSKDTRSGRSGVRGPKRPKQPKPPKPPKRPSVRR